MWSKDSSYCLICSLGVTWRFTMWMVFHLGYVNDAMGGAMGYATGDCVAISCRPYFYIAKRASTSLSSVSVDNVCCNKKCRGT